MNWLGQTTGFLIALLILLDQKQVLAQESRSADFLESFVLSEDRDRILDQLLPGTDDSYFYRGLHLLHQGQHDEVRALLKKWDTKNRNPIQKRILENRLALLDHPQNPERIYPFLKDRLSLGFGDEFSPENTAGTFPSELDPSKLTFKAFASHGLRNERLGDFSSITYPRLLREDISAKFRHAILAKLKYPTIEGLVGHIIDDVKEQRTNFGDLEIHRALTRAQLDECLKRLPRLLLEESFISTYVRRLNDEFAARNRETPNQRIDRLTRVAEFLRPLPPSFNSLKAHNLYHLLDNHRRLANYDRALFLEYLAIPRLNSVTLRRVLEQTPKTSRADLKQSYKNLTGLPDVGIDRSLIIDYLIHLLRDEASFADYQPFIDTKTLRETFAIAKLRAGLGDPVEWARELGPERFESFQKQVEILFPGSNSTEFGSQEPVALDVLLKNVPELIVKVYEINAKAYFEENGRDIPVNIDLDGLIPNDQLTFAFDFPATQSFVRRVEFPSLNRPGTYVLDFIGNGRSSRALVHKGSLQYVGRASVSGYVLNVVDEQGTWRDDATVWIGGHEFSAQENGDILIPYSQASSEDSIILSAGSLSCRHAFRSRTESYSLHSATFVDHQSLIPGEMAEAIIRPELRIRDQVAPFAVLEDFSVTLVAKMAGGTETSQTFSNLTPELGKDLVVPFSVPDRLRELRFEVRAKVRQRSRGKSIQLADSTTIRANDLDDSRATSFLHLSRTQEDTYQIEVLGRNGEALANRIITLGTHYQGVNRHQSFRLQSNADGLIKLPSLANIERLTATHESNGVSLTDVWDLTTRRANLPTSLHEQTSEPLRIPYVSRGAEVDRDIVSLLRVSPSGRALEDVRDRLKLRDGYIELSELQEGDYQLFVGERKPLELTLSNGKPKNASLVSNEIEFQQHPAKPVVLGDINIEGDLLKVQLAQYSDQTRLHVLATDFSPRQRPDTSLRLSIPGIRWSTFVERSAQYQLGRILSDEYLYVLARQSARKFPGVMLNKPSLLLNPWNVADTLSEEFQGDSGGGGRRRGGGAASAGAGTTPSADAGGLPLTRPNFDFLRLPSEVATNLVPNDQGMVVLTMEDLGPREHLHILALDTHSLDYQEVVGPSANRETRDLRQGITLDSEASYLQRETTFSVDRESPLTLELSRLMEVQVIDSLNDVYRYFQSRGQAGSSLSEFEFLIRWDQLSAEERRALVSKHACHELHLFLWRKDPDFFNQVIKPFIAHKKEKGFIDRWLLEEDLSVFTQPWALSRLNALEKALLSHRLEGEASTSLKQRLARLSDRPEDQHLRRAYSQAFALDSLDFEGVDLELNKELMRGKYRSRGTRRGLRLEEKSELAPEPETRAGRLFGRNFLSKNQAQDIARLAQTSQFYAPLEETQEWAESQYYRVRRDANGELIPHHAFWSDLAAHDLQKPFVSKNFLFVTANRNEMLAALALLDFPLRDPESSILNRKDDSLDVSSSQPALVLARMMIPVESSSESSPSIQVQTRTYESADDMFLKPITDEFITGIVYRARTSITNGGTKAQTFRVMSQIPEGAIPCAGSQSLSHRTVSLSPFQGQAIDIEFYFPEAGDFQKWPSQAATEEEWLAKSDPLRFPVVIRPTKIDEESWQHIARHGTLDQVLSYLNRENLEKVDLSQILPRLKDQEFYAAIVESLRSQTFFHQGVWSYGIFHQDEQALREYLPFRDDFVGQCGLALESPLLKIDPLERHWYEHLEYRPLIAARSHSVGGSHPILNNRLRDQYQSLLRTLSYQPSLSASNRAELTYYLLLQNRIDEALEQFEKMPSPNDSIEMKLQVDYLSAYLAFFREDISLASSIAARYRDYPVEHWRKPFADVLKQVEEIRQAQSGMMAQPSEEDPSELPASFDFFVERNEVTLSYQGLESVDVSYYLMDIELLFSQSPFLVQSQERPSYIRANASEKVDLPRDSRSQKWALPESLKNQNILVELVADGARRTLPYFANSLTARLIPNQGHLHVTESESGQPLSKVYVKVYSKTKDGKTSFHRDGYTDLRGRFDYVSVSRKTESPIEKYAILILSPDHGAIVREVEAPQS